MDINSIKQAVSTLIENKGIYLSRTIKDISFKDFYQSKEFSDLYNYCTDKECELLILFKGNFNYKCDHCHEWQITETKNEYQESCELLGYNPVQTPLCNYSDSYFYCKYCDEYNFIDTDDYYEYIEEGKIKINNYIITNEFYIFNDNAKDIIEGIYTLEHYELYNRYCTKKDRFIC
jgi:hypothetical protein